MIYNILIATILIIAFFMCIGAYCLGLKHGKQLSNAVIPQVNINPVKPIVDAIEQKKEEKQAEVLVDIMEYSRESALNSIKRGEKLE
jgi:hypothetical protein